MPFGRELDCHSSKINGSKPLWIAMEYTREELNNKSKRELIEIAAKLKFPIRKGDRKSDIAYQLFQYFDAPRFWSAISNL